MFTSPESLCDKFWRSYLSKNVKDKVGLFVFDECHCIRVWGDDFRPLYKDVSYLRATAPKIPIMLLSATLPPHLENQICQDVGVQWPYKTISLPLNRANIFYSIRKKESLPIDFRHLANALYLATERETVPKTLVFCLTKDSCFNIFTCLQETLHGDNEWKRSWVGIYHASMSSEAKSLKQKSFKLGSMRVLIATSAFGMGVNIGDISNVVLYGPPVEGLMFSQLSGRGGRITSVNCVCELMFSAAEVKRADRDMALICSGEVCIREVLIKNILSSHEILPDIEARRCCSICSQGTVPVVYPVSAGEERRMRSKVVKEKPRRITAKAKTNIKENILLFRKQQGECGYRLRGLDSVMPLVQVDNVVKAASGITSVDDLLALSVQKKYAADILNIIRKYSPENSVSRVVLRDSSNKI